MAKKDFILHAWYEKPENNWYPWLKVIGNFTEKFSITKIPEILPFV